MAVYEWKTPYLYSVSAQVAGETIEALKTALGKENIEPEDLLEASKPEEAPLHTCFEWDDSKAAEKYRLEQATNMIRSVVVKISVEDGEPVITRAFVNVSEKPRAKGTFVSIQTALEKENYRQNILRNALFELQTFQRKYATYAELAEVFSAIDKFAKKFSFDSEGGNNDN